VALVDRMKNNTRNSLGHFVGMDVHDTESIEMGWPGAEVMKPGMVFSIEFGLSLKDNYVVTETGIENLTASLPRELEEIERLMAEPSSFSRPKTTTSASQR
jgi:Xaa-Pro aminopeptidase